MEILEVTNPENLQTSSKRNLSVHRTRKEASQLLFQYPRDVKKKNAATKSTSEIKLKGPRNLRK